MYTWDVEQVGDVERGNVSAESEIEIEGKEKRVAGVEKRPGEITRLDACYL